MNALIGFAAIAVSWMVSSALKERLSKLHGRLVAIGLVACAAAVTFVGVSSEVEGALLVVLRSIVLLTFWTGTFTFVRSFRGPRAGATGEGSSTSLP